MNATHFAENDVVRLPDGNVGHIWVGDKDEWLVRTPGSDECYWHAINVVADTVVYRHAWSYEDDAELEPDVVIGKASDVVLVRKALTVADIVPGMTYKVCDFNHEPMQGSWLALPVVELPEWYSGEAKPVFGFLSEANEGPVGALLVNDDSGQRPISYMRPCPRLEELAEKDEWFRTSVRRMAHTADVGDLVADEKVVDAAATMDGFTKFYKLIAAVNDERRLAAATERKVATV